MKLSTSVFVLVLVLVVGLVSAAPIYVYHGDPYIPGPFLIDNFFIDVSEGIPIHASVWYPTGPGNFALMFYIGGLGGIVPSMAYGEVLRGIASHGVVVVGINTFWPFSKGSTEDEEEALKKKDIIDKFFQTLDFLQQNLNQLLEQKVPGVSASFDHVLFSGHSAGVDAGMAMLNRNCSWAHAAVMLEGGFGRDVNFTLPTLIYGTELAPQHSPILGACGRDINIFYDEWVCPRAVMNVTTFGHCDVLDPFFWLSCRETQFCKTADGTNLPLYRIFAQGVVTAWIVGIIQGNCDTLKYVTNPDLMPIDMQLTLDQKYSLPQGGDENAWPIYCLLLGRVFWSELLPFLLLPNKNSDQKS